MAVVDVRADDEASERAERLLQLRETYRDRAGRIRSAKALVLVDLVMEAPIVTARLVEDRLGVTRPTALNLLSQLAAAGVLAEGEAGARGQRRFVAHEVLAALTT